jgi:hypothetical protein
LNFGTVNENGLAIKVNAAYELLMRSFLWRPSAFTSLSFCLFEYFWYFWLTIQNTKTSQAHSLFRVAGVFISFPLVRAAARPPTPPRPPFLGGKYQKKIACSVGGWRLGKILSAWAWSRGWSGGSVCL